MKNERPKRLEIGMRVVAICMGKSVGDYVVINVGEEDARQVAFLAVRGDDSKKVTVVAGRDIDERNNSVKVYRGQKIQCTDYYYGG